MILYVVILTLLTLFVATEDEPPAKAEAPRAARAIRPAPPNRPDSQL